MKKIMVSGCYDILHGGHVEFFQQAKALGDYLIVSFASDDVLLQVKGRKSSIPQEHKKRLIESLQMVDRVVIGTSVENEGLDFIDSFVQERPDAIVATEDDRYAEKKKALCASAGWPCEYITLPKTLNFQAISTTDIINWIKAPKEVPLRVDFAGGWLDVPTNARAGGIIVNCTITPMVSLDNWKYRIGGGLGGSAAYSILSGRDGVCSELQMGVGWQDPAAIIETGLCVWKSGDRPVLSMKRNPSFLRGLMALLWTGNGHDTPTNASRKRDYNAIVKAGNTAEYAVSSGEVKMLSRAVHQSYEIQLAEGMAPLPYFRDSVKKYCGGGWGGYALYLFQEEYMRDMFLKEVRDTMAIEPYMKGI